MRSDEWFECGVMSAEFGINVKVKSVQRGFIISEEERYGGEEEKN